MDRYSGPVGSCFMRCCGAWEEDENAVNWGSFAFGGYLHWGTAECRPSERAALSLPEHAKV